jgi:hypothetical protein
MPAPAPRRAPPDDDGVQMGIVEIEQIGRYRVEERCAHRIEPFRTADDRDVAAPLNGNNVRNAAVTAGSFAEPSAVAKKFRIERFAS